MMTFSDMGNAASMAINPILLFIERLMKKGLPGRLGKDVIMKNALEDQIVDMIPPTERVTPLNANLMMIEGRVTQLMTRANEPKLLRSQCLCLQRRLLLLLLLNLLPLPLLISKQSSIGHLTKLDQVQPLFNADFLIGV